MAVSKNLEKGAPMRFKSGEKAAESGRKGGKASGRAKKQKKLLRECLEALLDREITDKSGKKMSGAEAMAVVAFREALEGNFKAWEIVRDTVGQKPADRVMVAEVDPDIIQEIEDMVNGTGAGG